jgi:hypothetical protein
LSFRSTKMLRAPRAAAAFLLLLLVLVPLLLETSSAFSKLAYALRQHSRSPAPPSAPFRL